MLFYFFKQVQALCNLTKVTQPQLSELSCSSPQGQQKEAPSQGDPKLPQAKPLGNPYSPSPPPLLPRDSQSLGLSPNWSLIPCHTHTHSLEQSELSVTSQGNSTTLSPGQWCRPAFSLPWSSFTNK